MKSALRYGNQTQTKIRVEKPIEQLSTFKPFTVREIDFQVWDSITEHQVDNYLA